MNTHVRERETFTREYTLIEVRQVRRRARAMIEELIALVDDLDGDCDLEDDLEDEACDDRPIDGDYEDCEPSLGWNEEGCAESESFYLDAEIDRQDLEVIPGL